MLFGKTWVGFIFLPQLSICQSQFGCQLLEMIGGQQRSSHHWPPFALQPDGVSRRCVYPLRSRKPAADSVIGKGGASIPNLEMFALWELMMRQLFGSVGLIVVTMLGAYAALAQDDIYSAKNIVPGCRDFLGAGDLGEYCVGLVIGVARYAYQPSICLPKDITDEQIVRAVVQYIDSQPARLQEDFVPLATEALRKTWPCAR